jgi:hypothetical protein
MATMEELQKQFDEMKGELEKSKKELQRLKDIEEIKKVMDSYEYLHYPITFPEKIHLFALDMPDVSMDVGDSGVFVGREGIETIFLKILGTARFAKGAYFMHCITTDYIEVAEDGQTAKAVFMSPGLETYYEDHSHVPPECYKEGEAKMQAYWCWGRYSADFIKRNGEWKIWHLKWWRDFRCDYHKGWVDDAIALSDKASYQKRPDAANDMPFVKPMKFNQPYNPKERKAPLPRRPKPYETWDDADLDWPFEGYEELIGKRTYDIESHMW